MKQISAYSQPPSQTIVSNRYFSNICLIVNVFYFIFVYVCSNTRPSSYVFNYVEARGKSLVSSLGLDPSPLSKVSY